MNNAESMRYRAATKTKHRFGHTDIISQLSITPEDSRAKGDDEKMHNNKLHIGVWIRFIAMISLFTGFSLSASFISRIGAGEPKPTISDDRNHPRFVTIVMPSVVNPYARPHRLANIAKTWGPSARAIYVVHSTKEYLDGGDNNISEASIYPKNLLVPTNIGVDQGVARLEHVIRTVYSEINPDFGFFINDHTFVLPSNLCQFVQSLDSSKDLYAGHALKGKGEVAFNSGAAGYVLSRSTMAKLINEWDNPNSKCVATNASKWHQGNPGILMAECFGHVLNIPVVDTRDYDDDLSHRFHAYGLVRTVTGQFDDWYNNKHETLDDVFGVDAKYHHQLQEGENCCSKCTVSFHYVEAGESLALWDVMQTIHQSQLISDSEVKEYMYKVWPTDGLGFYSHSLPDPQLAIWNDLVKVVRKISAGAMPPSC